MTATKVGISPQKLWYERRFQSVHARSTTLMRTLAIVCQRREVELWEPAVLRLLDG